MASETGTCAWWPLLLTWRNRGEGSPRLQCCRLRRRDVVLEPHVGPHVALVHDAVFQPVLKVRRPDRRLKETDRLGICNSLVLSHERNSLSMETSAISNGRWGFLGVLYWVSEALQASGAAGVCRLRIPLPYSTRTAFGELTVLRSVTRSRVKVPPKVQSLRLCSVAFSYVFNVLHADCVDRPLRLNQHL